MSELHALDRKFRLNLKSFSETAIVKLFTDQSEVSALPTKCTNVITPQAMRNILDMRHNHLSAHHTNHVILRMSENHFLPFTMVFYDNFFLKLYFKVSGICQYIDRKMNSVQLVVVVTEGLAKKVLHLFRSCYIN